MAVKSKVGLNKTGYIPGPPKKSRQGDGMGTKYAYIVTGKQIGRAHV